jgi:FAD/FMN-containing dehydrogenase
MTTNQEADTRTAALFVELRAALDGRSVLTGGDIPERNRQDWSNRTPVTPLAVVRPEESSGVARVMRRCCQLGGRVGSVAVMCMR